jgi:hypothetical protein
MNGRSKICPPLEQEIHCLLNIAYPVTLFRNTFCNTTATSPPLVFYYFPNVLAMRSYDSGERRQNRCCQRNVMRPACQQATYPVDVLWQHAEGPLGGGQAINTHPVGHVPLLVALEVVVVFALVVAVVFLLFFAVVFLPAVAVVAAGTVLFAAGSGFAGATSLSTAQAGTTKIKANKHINILFMVISLWLYNIHYLPCAKRIPSANKTDPR